MANQVYYVHIPKDLNDIKEKFMFNLTKRQCICFGIGILVGFPVFFLTKGKFGLSGALFAMGAVASPAIICGLYRKNGLFFEQVIRNMVAYFKKPRVRVYENMTVWEKMEEEMELKKLKKLLRQAERRS